MRDHHAVRLAGALAIVALAVGVMLAIPSDDETPKPKTSTTIAVDGPDADRKRDDTITVPNPAVVAATRAPEAEVDENLKTETPVGVAPSVLEEAREQQDRLAQTDQLPIVTPDAAPEQRGCASRFVRNYSSRRGVRPRWIVIHYTVSPNLPGVRDLLGLTARANDPSSQVSWTYNIDRDGNCFYTVRESDKPWTQAAANSVSIGIEIVNSGRETPFMLPAGYRKLGLVISDAARRWEIPLQVGRVKGCSVEAPGIITHQMLGPCGGGHVDISPFTLPAVLTAAKEARAASEPKRITAVDRRTCRKLTWWRAHGRPHGLAERRAVRRRVALARRDVTCSKAGAVRTR